MEALAAYETERDSQKPWFANELVDGNSQYAAPGSITR